MILDSIDFKRAHDKQTANYGVVNQIYSFFTETNYFFCVLPFWLFEQRICEVTVWGKGERGEDILIVIDFVLSDQSDEKEREREGGREGGETLHFKDVDFQAMAWSCCLSLFVCTLMSKVRS